MMTPMKDWIASLADAKVAPIADGARSAKILTNGSMRLLYYQPRGADLQTPHTQDEIYIVMSGSGTYAVGPSEDTLERYPFKAGDAIFTPAGHVHRFEDFTDDFGTWVVFWGPEGGESG